MGDICVFTGHLRMKITLQTLLVLDLLLLLCWLHPDTHTHTLTYIQNNPCLTSGALLRGEAV